MFQAVLVVAASAPFQWIKRQVIPNLDTPFLESWSEHIYLSLVKNRDIKFLLDQYVLRNHCIKTEIRH